LALGALVSFVVVAPDKAAAQTCFASLSFQAGPAAVTPRSSSVSESFLVAGVWGGCGVGQAYTVSITVAAVTTPAAFAAMYGTTALFFGVDNTTTTIWTLFAPAVTIQSASGAVVPYGGFLTAGTVYTVTVAPGYPQAGVYPFTAPSVAPGTFPGFAMTVAALPGAAAASGPSVPTATRAAINSFLQTRSNAIMGAGPDSSRLQARLGASANDNDTGNGNPAPSSGFAATANGSAPGVTTMAGSGFPGTGSALGYGGMPSSFGGSSVVAGPLGALSSPRSQMGSGSSPFGSPSGLGADPTGVGGMRREYDADPSAGRTGMQGFQFSGSGDSTTGRFAFATSLSQLREAAAAEDARKRASVSDQGSDGFRLTSSGEVSAPSKLGLGSGSSAPRPGTPAAFDIWVQGTSSYFTNTLPDARYQGRTNIMMSGADYKVMPGLIIGVMAQTDWMGQSSSGSTLQSGLGWMAGPYLSARLDRNLFLDVRALGGKSSNKLDMTDATAGAWSDTYSTNRVLASAKLTGVYTFDAWRIRPSAELMYFAEHQKAFINALGIDIDSQTVSVGRLNFGPEFGYRMVMPDKTVLEPFVGLTGVWDFARTDALTTTGIAMGQEGLRGRVEGGLSYSTPSGIMVRGAAAYDGVGSSTYHAVQGRAAVVIPLQ